MKQRTKRKEFLFPVFQKTQAKKECSMCKELAKGQCGGKKESGKSHPRVVEKGREEHSTLPGLFRLY